MELRSGTYLHRKCFKVIEKIDRGGFGITYLAEEVGWLKSTGFGEQFVQNVQPETVVIKELFFDDFCSRNEQTGLVYVTNANKKIEFEKLVNKQLEEGRIIKNLNHQNIVNTKDIFQENDTAYMVLEYIDGVNLEKIITSGEKLSQQKALLYIQKILSAVIYIHERKVLHLDISPSNILIRKTNDEPVLIDFGAAQTYSVDNHVASETSKLVAGFKKHYAPFEQQDIDNLKEFDPTFDTYAIGATLYFLLTGTPPPLASYILSGREKLLSPSEINQSVNPQLDKIFFKALNPKYNERYRSAQELLNDIEKIKKTDLKQQTELIPNPIRINITEKENQHQKKETELIVEHKTLANEFYKDDARLKVMVSDTQLNRKPLGKLNTRNTLFYGLIIIFVIVVITAFLIGFFDPPATYLLKQAKQLDSLADYKNARIAYEKAVKHGNAEAAYNLAGYYLLGLGGLSKDSLKAVELYENSSDMGFARAQCELGYYYDLGLGGLPQNELSARELYQKSADQGYAIGQFNLGIEYLNGFGGVPTDSLHAVKLFQLAAAQDNPSAENELGFLYNYGFGGLSKDQSKARELYERSAAQGNAAAQYNLGLYYENGQGGLQIDLSKAKEFLQKSADQNYELAKKELEFITVIEQK